jgi:hypothetical protein
MWYHTQKRKELVAPFVNECSLDVEKLEYTKLEFIQERRNINAVIAAWHLLILTD